MDQCKAQMAIFVTVPNGIFHPVTSYLGLGPSLSSSLLGSLQSLPSTCPNPGQASTVLLRLPDLSSRVQRCVDSSGPSPISRHAAVGP